MTRPLIVDTFPFNNELDILEMRLTELQEAVDHFVIVEATVDHQDHPKPLWFADHRERFAPWADKITHVIADRLPTHAENNDPWAREHAQREWIGDGLARLDLSGQDIILQSDVDEIPRAIFARNVRPAAGMLVFGMRFHCFAIDWQHPELWHGTVAASVATLVKLPAGKRFAFQRDNRMRAQMPAHMTDAGWHFSWLGGRDASLAKLNSFCHPEIAERTESWLQDETFWREGYHVDGKKQTPVEVDGSWPLWIREGHAPQQWFRPR